MAALALGGCHTNVPADTTATIEGAPVDRTSRAELPAGDPETSSQTVPVILEEWRIRVPEHVPAGIVTFEVHNAGLIPHELSVFRTDLGADAIPVVGGRADVSVPEATASSGELPPGGLATLVLDLEPGHYVLLSNLPAQYEAGMRTSITVE